MEKVKEQTRNELDELTKLVTKLLTEEPELRNCNDWLYLRVLQERGVENVPLYLFFEHRGELKAPPFESVVRIRRKVAAENPELKESDVIGMMRTARQITFEEWMR